MFHTYAGLKYGSFLIIFKLRNISLYSAQKAICRVGTSGCQREYSDRNNNNYLHN